MNVRAEPLDHGDLIQQHVMLSRSHPDRQRLRIRNFRRIIIIILAVRNANQMEITQ